MRIQHNVAAMNSHRSLSGNSGATAKNLEKLSSGFKINRAGDDAAGLAISEKMRSQIRGLETAAKNSNDGISLIQTAEGALTEVHSMLNRMVELATQSSNGTYDDTDRSKLQAEVDSLNSEINRIAEGTNFNGKKLLDGSLNDYAGTTTAGTLTGATMKLSGGKLNFAANTTATITLGGAGAQSSGATVAFTGTTLPTGVTFELTESKEGATGAPGKMVFTAKIADNASVASKEAWQGVSLTVEGYEVTGTAANATSTFVVAAGTKGGGMNLQVGDTSESFNRLEVKVDSMSAGALKTSTVDISTEGAAATSIDVVNDAIKTVSTARSNLGAVQNRLEHTIANLGVTTENMTAAESRIRDVDMASEMMSFTKNNILQQAAQAMLAQANQQPQGVLQLLR